jgi:outer membrane protein assembly factor BamB
MTSDPAAGQPSTGTHRRSFLVGGVGALVGAAAVGSGWAISEATGSEDEVAETSAPSTPPPPPMRRFVSTQLRAPETTVTRAEGAALSAGLIFTTPRTPTFRSVIYDDSGSPVWIEPDGNASCDLRVQEYRGQRVLTYWTGEILLGTGNGKGVLLDEQYRTVAEVRAGNGVLADIHEFQLTSRGTALITSYPTLPYDLTPVGGPAEGFIWGGRLQEIDVETGEVLLDWEGMEHIDLDETYRELDADEEEGETPGTPFDPIHVNSVEEDGDALLISARHTCALYKIDRRTGEVIWRFGGKKSDIEVPEGGAFGWQHDLRRQPDGTLTIYDNHEHLEETDDVSAALRFRLDEKAMKAELVQALRHEDRYGYAMGNAQYLADGHVFVGWGMDPYATEFDENGEVVFELGGLGLGSYRSYRFPWTARPTTKPDIGLGPDGAAYCSWNGATEVASWRVLTGATRDGLRPAGTARRDGFETRVEVGGDTAWFQAEALDAKGVLIGRSAPTRQVRL